MVKVFIDFDGTITRRDVGDTLFERFGGKQSVDAVESYRQGMISAVECFLRECAACGDVSTGALNSFLDEQEIDPTFIDFIQYCRERGLEHFIVSDGMDYYIRYILHRHGVEVPLFSNSLTLIPKGDGSVVQFYPSFPYTDEVCDRCACCKRNHMLTLCEEDDIIVYIGEGYSDRCPARFADVVFAKDDLLRFCQQENISFFEYQTFADIQKRLTTMLNQNISQSRPTLKKRRQAELARRDVFLGG
ncbi:MAG: MtnX-like HAD-IB family phosphatase [Ignavibacteria bacterium]|nr:MtnX-like HAD-IB family phosphatase [Ignavibacteria bacterium]MBI3766732.1 MtnX-like HAD-IB family phosphatase [Ignavibacteriales bacterium]